MLSFVQSSLLAGLAALAVPILIHLFFRLRTKRVELGTIRFLRIVMEENARRRKVMQWLLLALRLLFVALLAGLFARPYLTAQPTSTDNDLMVILIDQSATMQLKGERGRLIDQAIAEARQLVQSAAKGTRTEIAFFDHLVRPVATTATDAGEPPSFMDRLQAPAALFGATNYGVVMSWARDICVKAPPGHKQLHLFTDLQRSGLDWTDVEPLPVDVRTHLHDLRNSVVNNVAVTEIRTPRLWVRPGESPSVRASVLHGGAFSLSEVPIVLELGRAEVDSMGKVETPAAQADFAKLADRMTKRERVKLEPGATALLDFELPPLKEGLWQGRITVEYDDDLAFDNRRYFAISASPAYRVLIVNGGENNTSVTGETYFLESALRLAPAGESFAESPFEPTVVAFTANPKLPELSVFDAVVLANVAGINRADASRLAQFVKKGGGLLVFTGETVTEAGCAELDHSGLGVGKIGEIKITEDLPYRLTKWDELHPVLQPLNDPQHGDLRRLVFAAYTRVVPSRDARVLVEFGTGDPAVIERQIGEGSVFWVTVSCGRDWSDWSRSRLFLPIIHQLLGYQVGLAHGGRIRTRLVDTQLPVDSSEEKSDAEQKPSAGDGPSATPGIVQFDRYSEVINTSPRESDVERCSRQEFEDRFAMKFVDDDAGPARQAAGIANVEFQRDEIWHWVACALLIALLLEGFVGNRTTA